MNASQIENQIIQNSKGLPADILQEILDFIQFLKIKRAGIITDSVQKGLSEFNSSEVEHLEEEFTDYKTLYPRE